MAIYTTSFQNEMHRYDFLNLTYEQKLQKLCNLIFDFNFNYKNQTFKAWFEQFFIEHFFNEEIAFETLDYFKIKLKAKMNEVLPFYVLKYEYFQNLTSEMLTISYEMHKKTSSDFSKKSTGSSEGASNDDSASSTNSNNKYREITSDLPIDLINSDKIDDVSYANFGKLDETTAGSTTNSNSAKNETSNFSNDENSSNNLTDDIVNVNYFDNLQKYSNEFVNMSTEMINKFNDLFLIIF